MLQIRLRCQVSGVNVTIYASVGTGSGSTIAAGVRNIRTQYHSPTYTDLSSLVGGASYARVSKAGIDSAGYPAAAYFRSTVRYMPNGTTEAVNGGYWLLTVDGRIDVRMLGAKCDGITLPQVLSVLSSLQRFWVAVFGAVAAGCGAEPFRLPAGPPGGYVWRTVPQVHGRPLDRSVRKR